MNFPLLLFYVFLNFPCAFCEKCSESLHEAFKKSFNLTDACDDCVIESPGISFGGDSWEGFCIGNKVFLFKNRECSNDCKKCNKSVSVAIITNDSCELVKDYHDLDEQCLKELNNEIFRRLSESPDLKNQNKKKRFVISSPTDSGNKNGSVGFSISTSSFGRRTSTESSSMRWTKTTTTEKTTTETTITESTKTTITTKSTEFTTETTSEANESNESKPCEPNEFFFEDHCYFLNVINSKHNLKMHKKNLRGTVLSDIINSTAVCQSRHYKALGLAVETKKENKFILNFLKSFYLYKNYTIFTSGMRVYGLPDTWRGWNLKINQSVLNIKENDFQSSDLLYCIDACKGHWYLFSSKMLLSSPKNHLMVCERPYNPKNIQPELYKQCLQLYRKSSCYNLRNHSNFCCEKDETGEIWFACPDETHTKKYSNNVVCRWTCKKEGFFIQDRPTCRGSHSCSESYNSIRYVAPVTKYAISDCPENYLGHSTWYCNWNKTFLGEPDYSLCCENTNLQCRDLDAFLNIWMGCPSKKITKRTACPPGMLLKEAVVEWYCRENGTFNGSSPNYSNCNAIQVQCSKIDRFGLEWVAVAGTTGKNACPPPSTGFCYWKCKNSGKFDGPEPDCSKCKTAWMEEVAQKIKNQSNHQEVMKIMENYTEKEDLRIGYGHVLALTNDCVALFKKQNPKFKIDSFDKFLKSYSKILRNVAGKPKLWLSFLVSNRQEYTRQVLAITQKAAFANLDSKNWFGEQYNATFTKFEDDGFDFFVAYNPLELKFPLENFSESNWHLDIKEIGERNFAVMGLVMIHSLSSVMFPRGNQTKNLEMNSPALTFAVAASKNGQVQIDPNVVVSISFKHKSQTRFPLAKVIPRKLHEGESPSGVFNSTVCYYYRNSDWNSEGCYVTFTSKDRTNCTCRHLSTIGLLMSVHQYKPNKTLEFVSIISSGITIMSLILALLVFHFCDKGKNDRALIGKNLCFCLLVGHTLLITVMDKKFFNIPDNICTIYAVLLHYIFMAALAWMFVEGYHLYRMLVLVFNSDVEYRWIYLLIGYGGPFVIVSVTKITGIIFQEQPYGQDELCWLKTPNYVWAFMGPVFASTSINFCILIISMKLAISSKRRIEKFSLTTLKLWIKGWISLSTLLGITWFFGLAYICYNEAFVYLFVILNGLQGFFIFIFRCVLCEQYKTIILKKVKPWFSKFKLKGCKKSENAKSETKLFVISATKSSEEIDIKDSGYDPGSEDLEDSKKIQNKMSNLKSNVEDECRKNSCGINIDVNFSLQPTLSVAYLRNRAIAKNFSARKSKATWLAESCDFPELSYHNIHHPN